MPDSVHHFAPTELLSFLRTAVLPTFGPSGAGCVRVERNSTARPARGVMLVEKTYRVWTVNSGGAACLLKPRQRLSFRSYGALPYADLERTQLRRDLTEKRQVCGIGKSWPLTRIVF